MGLLIFFSSFVIPAGFEAQGFSPSSRGYPMAEADKPSNKHNIIPATPIKETTDGGSFVNDSPIYRA